MATMNIDILLKKYKLSQRELAESTGINENTISRYCNGTFKKIDKEHISLICKFFKCTPNDIFEIDDTVEVTPAKVLYYDDETDEFTEGEIKEPSNAFKRRANWNYCPELNISIPTLKTDEDIPEPIQKEYHQWMRGFVSNHRFTPKENTKQLDKQNNCNLIASDDESIELEQQDRLEAEGIFEENINLLLDTIISKYDPSIQEDYRELIATYPISKSFPLSYKLTTLYRVIYRLLSVQSQFELRDFIKKLRDIYVHVDLVEISDKELMSFYNDSFYYLDLLNTNKKD